MLAAISPMKSIDQSTALRPKGLPSEIVWTNSCRMCCGCCIESKGNARCRLVQFAEREPRRWDRKRAAPIYREAGAAKGARIVPVPRDAQA